MTLGTRPATRLLLTAGAASVLLLAVTGCEKPNPGVSVWSGTTSQHTQALCWSADATQSVEAAGCARDVITKAREGGQIPEISVIPGDTIGISVDPKVAANGWIPEVGSEPLATTPITSTYFRFTFPDLQSVPAEGLELRVLASGESNNDLRGLWVYRLVPAP